MRILVCVKQVPDLERIVVRDLADGTAAVDVANEFRMNRFDEFAVEEAVRIKESVTQASIDVITVGPPQAANVLKRPMGMGADAAVHLKTFADEYPGAAAVAACIAEYARTRGYKLILCGSMSEDGMNGQVGPMTAAGLGLPYATQVIAIQVASDPVELCVEREIEAGVREMLALRLPCLLTLQPGINVPRYPSLSRLLRAHRQPVETIPAEILKPGESLIECMGIMTPRRRRASRRLAGSAGEKAKQLADILMEKAFI